MLEELREKDIKRSFGIGKIIFFVFLCVIKYIDVIIKCCYGLNCVIL